MIDEQVCNFERTGSGNGEILLAHQEIVEEGEHPRGETRKGLDDIRWRVAPDC
jgi:hypothetical protein